MTAYDRWKTAEPDWLDMDDDPDHYDNDQEYESLYASCPPENDMEEIAARADWPGRPEDEGR